MLKRERVEVLLIEKLNGRGDPLRAQKWTLMIKGNIFIKLVGKKIV